MYNPETFGLRRRSPCASVFSFSLKSRQDRRVGHRLQSCEVADSTVGQQLTVVKTRVLRL
jgi:hypothetical protein